MGEGPIVSGGWGRGGPAVRVPRGGEVALGGRQRGPGRWGAAPLRRLPPGWPRRCEPARREPRSPGSFLSLPVWVFFPPLRLNRRVLHCSSSWAFPSVINKEASGEGGIPLSAAGKVSRWEVWDVNSEGDAAGPGEEGGGCCLPARQGLPLPAGSFI